MDYLLTAKYIKALSVSALILFVYSFYPLFKSISPNFFFHPDTLYYPSLYIDLFVDGFNLSGWFLPRVPGFFPNMPLFFMAMFLTQSTWVAFSLFIFIKCTTLLCAFYFISTVIFDKNDNYNFIFMLLMGTVLNLLVITDIGKTFFLGFFRCIGHGEIYVVSIIALLFTLKSIKNENEVVKNSIIIFLLSFLCIISNLNFITIFIVPSLVTFAILYRLDIVPAKTLFILSLSIILAAVLSFAGIHLIRNHLVWIDTTPGSIPYPEYYIVSKMLYGLKKLFSDLGYFFEGEILYYTMAWLGWLITSIVIMIKFYLKCLDNTGKNDDTRSLQLFVSTTYFVIVILFALFIPVLSGNYSSRVWFHRFNNMRNYMLAVFITPIFGISFWILLLNNAKKSLIATVLTIFCFVALAMHYDIKGQSIVGYYPKMVEDLDHYSSKYNLTFGLAYREDSHLITCFSKNNLRVFQMKGLEPGHYMNNIDRFFQAKPNESKGPDFNFFVKPDKKKIIEKFGSPAHIIKCGNQDVFIYNRPSDIKFRNQFTGIIPDRDYPGFITRSRWSLTGGVVWRN